MDISEDYNVKVLKNITNPVMFLGFPLNLAYLYILSIITGFFMALFLSASNVHWLTNILIPIIIIAVGVTTISLFYKKHGVHGYYLMQQDKMGLKNIKGDKSFQDLMLEKKAKRTKKIKK